MKVRGLITLLLMCVVVVSAQVVLPPPFPRTNATKLLDTDRITVWDIVWPKGQPTAMHRTCYDQVGTYYARGGRLITTPDGTARTAITEVGSLSTTERHDTHRGREHRSAAACGVHRVEAGDGVGAAQRRRGRRGAISARGRESRSSTTTG